MLILDWKELKDDCHQCGIYLIQQPSRSESQWEWEFTRERSLLSVWNAFQWNKPLRGTWELNVEQWSSNLAREIHFPPEFSSNPYQTHLPVIFLMILKTLISMLRSVWYGLELNSAGKWISRARFEDHWCRETIHLPTVWKEFHNETKSWESIFPLSDSCSPSCFS